MVEFDTKRLKAERVARGLDQVDIAKKLGMSRSNYSKKENGHIKLYADELATILDALNIPESDLGIFFTRSVANLETEGG
ncbi:helix-turn-helix domain-containing protein [Macrococcus capreoli]|uniref:helix-turn-helix domain-containing protein n=1 Tax=Macrococcus capreoli TaxID=2982690 RepID=UPI003EE4B2FF